MKICFIIQARVGSTRMPRKILLPFFDGKSIIELLIEKIKQINGAKIVIATSSDKSCDELEEIAKRYDVNCFRGSENDVLQRFIDAAEKFSVERIIRVCSDNPFLELSSIQELVEYVNSLERTPDYISFDINGTPSIKTHYGFWTEYVTLDALKRVIELTDEPLYHEHVTNYIYMHPDKFNIRWIEGPKVIENRPDIRLTIDTVEDFSGAQKIYSDLCQSNPYPTIKDIVSYLDRHSEYYVSMRSQIKQNSK